LQFLLFEDFLEHGKLICVLRVPKVRGYGKDYSEFRVIFSVGKFLIINKYYARQTLSNYNRIQSAFVAVKKRISNKENINVSGKKKTASYLLDMNEKLMAENERLKRENEQLLHQFGRWSYNAYSNGLTINYSMLKQNIEHYYLYVPLLLPSFTS